MVKKKSFGPNKASRLRFRASKGPRGLGRKALPPAAPMWVNGKKINGWEATVYRALQDMKEEPVAGLLVGPKSRLGGAMLDIALPHRKINFEVDGPFHNTAEGKERDFWRNLTRRQAGWITLRIKQTDLPHIRQVLARMLAAPVTASIMSR